MGKIVVTEFISLDGVIEDPGGAEDYGRGGWAFDFDRGTEGDKFKMDELLEAEAQLLGRVTYEGFAAAWPRMEDEQGFAERMNSMPKYVASRTLNEAEWNATIIEGEVAAEVAKLKEGSGGDLLIYGSGDLVDELTRGGLIDEYRLMVHPVVVGSGKRLFNEVTTTTLGLVESTITDTGVCVLTYAPAAGEAAV